MNSEFDTRWSELGREAMKQIKHWRPISISDCAWIELMTLARAAASGFFPLDEELELLPGKLTPRLQQSVVRMGAWMPFERAAGELEYLLGVVLVRRCNC